MPQMKFGPQESGVIIAYLTNIICDIGKAHGLRFKGVSPAGAAIDAIQNAVALRAAEWADMREALEHIAGSKGENARIAREALPE